MTNPAVVIVDYHMGNIGSIVNMLRKLGHSPLVTSDPSDLQKADRLILPGIGAFEHGMNNLNSLGLVPALQQVVLQEKKPILGICLGLQLMTLRSEEGDQAGLGWLDAQTIRFREAASGLHKLRVPHMGWNTVQIRKPSRLFSQPEEDTRFYFVHSYHAQANDQGQVIATTNYGTDFPSVFERNNICGVQFHPEKSHRFGMLLLEDFLEGA